MHIALICEKYPPDLGGLAVSLRRLATGLVYAGERVQVFALSNTQAPGETTCQEQDGYPTWRLGAFPRQDDTLGAWFRMVCEHHAVHPFDLLHGYFLSGAGFVAAYAGRNLGVPAVVSARGNDLDRAVFDPGKAAHVLAALRLASAVTANSRDLVRKASALTPGREVKLIQNGVDATLFHPSPPNPVLVRELGLQGRRTVGFCGEARFKKGLGVLLDAFAQLDDPQATLLLLGGVRQGEDREAFKSFCRAHLSADIRATPLVPQSTLPEWYNLLDVLALPSLYDGLPNALLEGLACGRAVVGTPVGGLVDVIVDKENGLMVPPGDARQLSETLARLLADGGLRAQLGQAGRQTVQQHFTPQAEVKATLGVYRSLTSDTHGFGDTPNA